jgi:hypothetical protein
VSYGVLNLSHRDSHSEPSALKPGAFYAISLKLNDCGYAFDPGHKIRIAVSSAYWPLIWPAPEAATLTIRSAGRLVLPVRAPLESDKAVQFEAPQRGKATPATMTAPGRMNRTATLDLVSGASTYVIDAEGGLFGEGAHRFDEIDSTVSHDLKRVFTIAADDPLTARYDLAQRYDLGREGWRIRIETKTSMQADADYFILRGTLSAFENDRPFATREWDEKIPRDFL